MSSPRLRVMAVVELDAGGAFVARRAWELAAADGARLALAHVMDWGTGLDDGFSPLAPSEVHARLAVVVSRRLDRMAAEVGAAGRATTLASPRQRLGHMLAGWQPDLVVASSRLGLVRDGRVDEDGWSCDGLTVEPPALRLWGEAARQARSLSWMRRPALRPR